jgi:hypothetical protein
MISSWSRTWAGSLQLVIDGDSAVLKDATIGQW